MATQFYFRAKTGVVYWRMAILRACIYAVMTGTTAFIGETENVFSADWAAMEWFDIFRIFAKVSVVVLGTILAFLDTTMGKLRQDHPENPDKPENQNPIPGIK